MSAVFFFFFFFFLSVFPLFVFSFVVVWFRVWYFARALLGRMIHCCLAAFLAFGLTLCLLLGAPLEKGKKENEEEALPPFLALSGAPANTAF